MERNLRRSPSRLAALSEMKRNQSPGRPKSPARKKSPARTKSPARKSPARKSPTRKSPARKPSKSPSRKKAAVPKTVSSIEKRVISIPIEKYTPSPQRDVNVKDKSPESVQNKKENRSNAEDLIDIRNSRSRERSRTVEEIRLSATRTLISGPDFNVEASSGGITRRSSRLRSSKELIDGFKKNIDEEVQKIIKSNHVTGSDYLIKSVPQEYGGKFGAFFLIFFIPLFVLALQLSCVNKDKCKLFDFHLSTNWKFYLDPYATAWFTGFVTWQFLLSIIPLYKKVTGIPPKNDSLEYRCSGIINALLSLSVIGALQYFFKYPVGIIVTKSVPLLMTSIIFGFFLSIVLFIKGGRPGVIQNAHGKTGNKVYDFWAGREINPRFGILDIKQTLTRIAVIGALIYDAAIIIRAIDNKQWSNYPPTILLVTGLQIFTLLDFLIFEEKFLSSFFMQHEGTGYMVVIGSFVFPFFITITPKFLLLNHVDLNVYYLTAIGVFYLLAYLVYRLSSNQKSNFRRNPLNPSLTNLESLPTVVSGKKLLVGGWWGVVRHPNYLGLILIYWILAASAGISHLAPYAVALASTVTLVHRAIRNSGRCKAIYSSSWDRYTQKVKYYLVPRVF